MGLLAKRYNGAVKARATAAGVIVLAMAVTQTSHGQDPRTKIDPLLQSARVALRLNTGEILLVGGRITQPYTGNGLLDDQAYAKLRKSPLVARQQPGDDLYLATSAEMARFTVSPATDWRPGEKWKLFLGAGQPVTVVIESLAVLINCGGTDGRAAAIARLEKTDEVDRLLGLRASGYLGAPLPGWKEVSSSPLMPVEVLEEARLSYEIGKALTARARKVVTGDNWLANGPNERASFQLQIRQMNHVFLNSPNLEPQLRYFRWNVPGRKPLLFVKALWAVKGKPLFAAEATLEEDTVPAILSFDSSKAQLMSIGSKATTGRSANQFC